MTHITHFMAKKISFIDVILLPALGDEEFTFPGLSHYKYFKDPFAHHQLLFTEKTTLADVDLREFLVLECWVMNCRIAAVQLDHRPHVEVGHVIHKDDITQRPLLCLAVASAPTTAVLQMIRKLAFRA